MKKNGQWEDLPKDDRSRKKYIIAQAYYNRLNRIRDDCKSLEDCQALARSLFGEELEQAIETLNRQTGVVKIQVDASARGDDANDRQLRNKIDQTLYEGYPTHE